MEKQLMLKLRRIGLSAVVVCVLGLMAVLVVPAAAQDEDFISDLCGTITHQVRFLDYNDIPLFYWSEDAELADAIFRGESDETLPQPVLRIPGGERQKYLLCNDTYDADNAFVEIVFKGFEDGGMVIYTYFAPTALVESIVRRNLADGSY
jgi:hypothetical protein